MANNQNVNKVVYGNTALIDLTGDDVTAGDVLSGKRFHLPSGAQALGTRAADTTVSIPIGNVDSSSTSTAFTATISGITELRDGVMVWLTNGVVTSAAGCTLNINGLGAKPIYNSIAAATATTTTFNVNYTMLFIYNSSRVTGGCWDMVYGYDSNTTYTPVKLGFGVGVCDTAAATAAKTVSMANYNLLLGGIVNIQFTNAVPADATLNINSQGAKPIKFCGANITADIIKAGDVATFFYSGSSYIVISIDTVIKAAIPKALSLTLASGSWSSASPSTQTLTATGVTATNHIVVGIASTITSAQYDAAAEAKLVCTAQGTNSITMTAFGDKPTENIPISVVILG